MKCRHIRAAEVKLNNAWKLLWTVLCTQNSVTAFYPFANKMLKHVRDTGWAAATRPRPGTDSPSPDTGFCKRHSGSCRSAVGAEGKPGRRGSWGIRRPAPAWLSAGAPSHSGCDPGPGRGPASPQLVWRPRGRATGKPLCQETALWSLPHPPSWCHRGSPCHLRTPSLH